MTDRDLAQAIAIALEKFLANADPTDAAICKLASLHSVLPTVRDWSAFIGLTSDGEVVCVDYNPPHEVTPANEQARHAGYRQGLRPRSVERCWWGVLLAWRAMC